MTLSPLMKLPSSSDMECIMLTLELFVSSPPFTYLGKEEFPSILCALVGKR